MRRKFLLICFLLVGCGDKSKDYHEVNITITEHRFNPEVVEVPAGEKIRITVQNQDKTIEEFESLDLKRAKIVPPNSKIKIILAPLKAGTYKFFGCFNQDTAQGKLIAN